MGCGGGPNFRDNLYDREIMAVNPMRIQAMALMTMDEKIILDWQAKDHETTLSTILRTSHKVFTALPRDEQAAWIKMAEAGKEST